MSPLRCWRDISRPILMAIFTMSCAVLRQMDFLERLPYGYLLSWRHGVVVVTRLCVVTNMLLLLLPLLLLPLLLLLLLPLLPLLLLSLIKLYPDNT